MTCQSAVVLSAQKGRKMLNYAGKTYSKDEVVEILVILKTGTHSSLMKKSDAFLKLSFFRYFDSVINLPDEVSRALDVLGSVEESKSKPKGDDDDDDDGKKTKSKSEPKGDDDDDDDGKKTKSKSKPKGDDDDDDDGKKTKTKSKPKGDDDDWFKKTKSHFSKNWKKWLWGLVILLIIWYLLIPGLQLLGRYMSDAAVPASPQPAATAAQATTAAPPATTVAVSQPSQQGSTANLAGSQLRLQPEVPLPSDDLLFQRAKFVQAELSALGGNTLTDDEAMTATWAFCRGEIIGLDEEADTLYYDPSRPGTGRAGSKLLGLLWEAEKQFPQ